MRHRPLRSAALIAVLAVLAGACGASVDFEGRRIVATPQPPGDIDTTVAPADPTDTPGADPAQTEMAEEPVEAPPPEPGRLAQARTTLTRIAALNQPLAMALRRGDPTLYIAEKGGRIRAIRDGTVRGSSVLDISGEISRGSEQGLLGLAFHPDGSRMYINFTNTLGNTIVREYAFSAAGADVASARTVLEVDQPFGNHNGGNLVFGPDGLLYIGLGDGGSSGDPQNNAQNVESLLGKMLRINPRPSGTQAYTIPTDNPFVGRDGRDEVWSFGLRNPWRYAFDRLTGDLWIGDVGQNAWEEVNLQPASSRGGENWGWNRMEGTNTFRGPEPPNHSPPIYEYRNDSANCSVTGGYVYRGERIRELSGAYVFADFCGGRLRAFVESDGRAREHRFLGPQVGNIASFGEDQAGELYVLSLGGGVYRIDPE